MMADSGDYGANGAYSDAASVEASYGDNTNGVDYNAYVPTDGYSDIHASQELTSEEDKYWRNVRENSSDFSSWMYLVQLIEAHGEIDKIRKAYDEFLVYFPLCFFYWKKYADHEAAQGNIDKAIEVFERGILAVPHSVDLWMYYCAFFSEKSGDVEVARNLWEKGASAVGNDFFAEKFWDKYIDFEVDNTPAKAVALYLRILHIPCDQLTQYHTKFKVFAASRPVYELLLPNEEAELGAIKKKHEQKYNELAAKKQKGEPIDLAVNGIKTGDEVEIEYRSVVMTNREELYKKTLEEVTKRKAYEQIVKNRPYFHVKPLDESMVSNWRKYLDFEERESNATNPARVVKLYERCLLAACYYSEFWLRYVKWNETHHGVEAARSVFHRASSVFLTRRADLHLEYALFEEVHGDIAKARQIYEHLQNFLPGHVDSTVRHVAFERRQGRLEAACALYETALAISALDKSSGPFLSIHYALYLERALGSTQRARELYETNLHKFPESKGLWLAYIQFESGLADKDKEKVLALYTRAIAEDSKLSQEDRMELYQSYVEYLSDWGDNPATIRRVNEAFRTMYPTYSFKAETARKRPLSDPSGTIDAPSKAARTGVATTPAASSYPQGATTTQYPYQYAAAAQYSGYSYPAAGYSYPYGAATTAGAATPAGGYSYMYPYGYTPTS